MDSTTVKKGSVLFVPSAEYVQYLNHTKNSILFRIFVAMKTYSITPNVKRFLLSTVFLFLLSAPVFAQQNYCGVSNAFLNESHPTSIDTQTVFVKKVVDYYGNNFWIKLNLHKPKGDNLPFIKRPLLIGIHGGAWVSDYSGLGTPSTDAYKQMSSILDTYCTKYGMTSASLDYRTGYGGGNEIAIGLEMSNPGSICNNPLADWPMMMNAIYDACYRATQDTRTALNYIFSYGSELGIDTSNIFIFGGSAGAITALHATYSTEHDFYPQGAGNLGALEPMRKIKGCISGMGGMFHRYGNNIDSSDKTPTQFFHGLADLIVPYNDGPLFNCNTITSEFSMHGDSVVAEQLCAFNIPNELVLTQKMGHDLTPDSVLIGVRIRNFIHNLICPPSGTDSNYHFVYSINGNLVSTSNCSYTHPDTNQQFVSNKLPKSFFTIYPNPASDNLSIQFAQPLEDHADISMYDILGKELIHLRSAEEFQSIDISSFVKGTYIVRISYKDSKISREIKIVK